MIFEFTVTSRGPYHWLSSISVAQRNDRETSTLIRLAAGQSVFLVEDSPDPLRDETVALPRYCHVLLIEKILGRTLCPKRTVRPWQ